MRLLIDEDLLRSLAAYLRAHLQIDVSDVRDVGLRGRPDGEIFSHAVTHHTVLVSRDTGFANILNFPPGSHAGIVVLRLPNGTSVAAINDRVVRALSNVEPAALEGGLMIIEPDRVRLRRA